MSTTTQPIVDVPLSPAAPEDVYFSQVDQAWIVSRYRDVLAALRCTGLSQARPPKAADVNLQRVREKIQADIVTALPSFPISKCQIKTEGRVSALLRRLPR